MIAKLSGTLADKGLDAVVVDVGGVGYLVSVSLQTLQALPPQGQPVALLTYLQVREDALQLFGFATAEERHAFELCISVSGVGPKLALATLSGLEPDALAEAITRGDVARLQRIPGIGKKTAERLVMELRDKFGPARGSGRGAAAGAIRATGLAGPAGDVAAALQRLGYRPQDAEKAAEAALAQEPGAALDVLLRKALRSLQRD
jgi:holliday junction DNA helicase RuvA